MAVGLRTCSADLSTELGEVELEGVVLVLDSMMLTFDYQFVFSTVMYESHYIALDLEPC